MAGNEIHLDNVYIGKAVIMMENLERRVENFHKEKTYDEILSEARDGLKKISPQEMTLDEYKAYIEGELQNIPRNITRHRDEVTIVISDAGYEAMQNDPEYEAWVLNGVREELSFPDYLCGYPGTYGRHEVIQFGATKEDYRGQSSAIRKHDSRHVEEESYWERRLKKLKARLKIEQELFEHEQLLQKAFEEPIIGVPAGYLLSMLEADV